MHHVSANEASGKSPQQHAGALAALGLADTCIYLAPDGSMRPCTKTAAFFRSAGTNAELAKGRVLALFEVRTPRDVHYPAWEMHPEGDELLMLASGALAVEFRDGDTHRTTPLPSRSALIVPAGLWHRLIVHEPSVLIAITPRHNTVHEKGNDETGKGDTAGRGGR
jgi:mannose-6-phosphate isomerase-like protein (cupin superfamily)